MKRLGECRNDLTPHRRQSVSVATAHHFERMLRDWTQKPTWNLKEEVAAGRIPKVYHESGDPNRKVPLVWNPESFLVCVTGDPARNSIYVFAHNGVLAFPVCKKVQLPKDWDAKLAALKK